MALFHPGKRELQDLFDTRRLADRLDELLVTDTIGASDAAFIGAAEHLFLGDPALDPEAAVE